MLSKNPLKLRLVRESINKYMYIYVYTHVVGPHVLTSVIPLLSVALKGSYSMSKGGAKDFAPSGSPTSGPMVPTGKFSKVPPYSKFPKVPPSFKKIRYFQKGISIVYPSNSTRMNFSAR